MLVSVWPIALAQVLHLGHMMALGNLSSSKLAGIKEAMTEAGLGTFTHSIVQTSTTIEQAFYKMKTFHRKVFKRSVDGLSIVIEGWRGLLSG
ncbi:hypothetical protein RY831_04770 [Noviherbaspirillum sp. CPCC 100848]|uniref:Transposase n=1 Tax=Noviherbaspirillum album TaxID=3080276 RepID=A0ABU6J492_9BURK|nr:hypothetical protein [Noviherbaspirillum sp. CPCC 100848]MEC4718447.1 hypothetical protein [Noviherbaspirillum sp. CPCC 100848]